MQAKVEEKGQEGLHFQSTVLFLSLTYVKKCYIIKKLNINHCFHNPTPEEIELHPRKRRLSNEEQAEYIGKDMFKLKARKRTFQG